jgi:hypothetical protein
MRIRVQKVDMETRKIDFRPVVSDRDEKQERKPSKDRASGSRKRRK